MAFVSGLASSVANGVLGVAKAAAWGRQSGYRAGITCNQATKITLISCLTMMLIKCIKVHEKTWRHMSYVKAVCSVYPLEYWCVLWLEADLSYMMLMMVSYWTCTASPSSCRRCCCTLLHAMLCQSDDACRVVCTHVLMHIERPHATIRSSVRMQCYQARHGRSA